jgi:hypothetical protein
MAYEMLHRNRFGRVDTDSVVTRDDVDALLARDDWEPSWRAAMIDTSYRPVTRTDARAAFQTRAISDDELKEALLDFGYNETSADLLYRYYDKRRTQMEGQQSGLPTIRTLVTQYSRGEISISMLTDLLGEIGISEQRTARIIKSANLARETYRKASAIKWIRQSYLNGMFDLGDAATALGDADIDGNSVADLLDQWQRQRVSRGKIPSAAQLCKWRNQNLISNADQLIALRRMGWSIGDAQRIAGSCTQEMEERAMRAAEKARREAEKAREKAEKEFNRRCGIRVEPVGCPVPDQSQQGQNGA